MTTGREYVVLQSVFKDENGVYWYNTDYDMFILGHRPKSSPDWRIVSRTQTTIALLAADEKSIPWVKTFQKYWVDVTPKLRVTFYPTYWEKSKGIRYDQLVLPSNSCWVKYRTIPKCMKISSQSNKFTRTTTDIANRIIRRF